MTEHTARERWARIVQQLPILLGLVLLWMLLWGSISWLNVVTGAVVAVVVTRVFYLPPVELSGRFNPFWFAFFLVRFGVDLLLASFQVAAQAFDPRGVSRNAVVAVQLRTRSDIMMTVTSIAMSLVPGSLIVEADRMRSVLYLHTLNTPDDASVERVRQKVLATEAALVRSFGSLDDLERTT